MAPMRNLDGGISAPTPLGNADFLNLHEYHGNGYHAVPGIIDAQSYLFVAFPDNNGGSQRSSF